MPHLTKPWPDSIPKRVRNEAFGITYDLLGSQAVGSLMRARQNDVFAHMVRVCGTALHTARQAGLGERAAERIARKAGGHDIGKAALAGISDSGVWTQERRLWVRKEHCVLGAAWATENSDRLPDAAALAFTFSQHHSRVPHSSRYMQYDPVSAEWWADVHWVQACDRLDAITTRPYVLEREGIFTASGAVALALAADPRAATSALPHDVYIEGQRVDLAGGLGEVAEVLVAA